MKYGCEDHWLLGCIRMEILKRHGLNNELIWKSIHQFSTAIILKCKLQEQKIVPFDFCELMMFFFNRDGKKAISTNVLINYLLFITWFFCMVGKTKLSYWIFFPFCISGILEHDNEDQNLTLLSPQNWIFISGGTHSI